MTEPSLAFVHDHIAQRGGSERVLLRMVRTFPGTPVYTSFFNPEATYPELAGIDVRPMRLNRIGPLRRHHRVSLPFLGSLFERLRVPGDVVVCNSSAWAHGARVEGTKVVYWHALAQWLYAGDEYLSESGAAPRAAVRLLRRRLLRWDQEHARAADIHVVYGTEMQRRVRDTYGVEARLLTPPVGVEPDGPVAPQPVEPGFWLAPNRLVAWKHVDAILAAFAELPGRRLVVAGDGPARAALEAQAPPNVTFLGSVGDEPLRWLYANCAGVVAAGREPYGLAPAEAAGFGKGAVGLGTGGLRETIVDGGTGTLFDAATPDAIRAAVLRFEELDLDDAALAGIAERHTEAAFAARLRAIVEDARATP